MRHRARSRKLGRTSAHRLAMYRNMVTSLLDYGRIETTDAKAKEVRRIADRMITLGKRGGLHARRRALRVIRHREIAAKVFDELAERYRDRPGGYTRVLKVRNRVGDAAPMSIVELVEALPAESGATKGGEKKAAGRKKASGEKAEGKKSSAGKTSSKKSTDSKSSSKKTSSKKSATKKSAGTKTAKKSG